MQKSKMAVWGGLTNSCEKKRSEKQRRKGNAKKQNGCLRRPYKSLRKEEKQKPRGKGKIYPFECRVPKNSKER